MTDLHIDVDVRDGVGQSADRYRRLGRIVVGRRRENALAYRSTGADWRQSQIGVGPRRKEGVGGGGAEQLNGVDFFPIANDAIGVNVNLDTVHQIVGGGEVDREIGDTTDRAGVRAGKHGVQNVAG